jgi:hypothetical protein
VLVPYTASAQQSTEQQIERTAHRFGLGVQGGAGLDPELLDFGAHGTFSGVFIPNISFRPGIEFGIGELTTLFGINLDVLYAMPRGTDTPRWSPYVGAGPNFALSHQGFENDNPENGSRFDFSDTDFSTGFNFIAGARNRGGTFFEMKATAYGVTNVRLLAGFTF